MRRTLVISILVMMLAGVTLIREKTSTSQRPNTRARRHTQHMPPKPKPIPIGENSTSKTLLKLHNRVRSYPLQLNSKLEKRAQAWAEHMARTERLTHSVLNRDEAENIAYGYVNEQAVFNGWMGSHGHKTNIKSERNHQVGFGVAYDSKGRPWWCAIFK